MKFSGTAFAVFTPSSAPALRRDADHLCIIIKQPLFHRGAVLFHVPWSSPFALSLFAFILVFLHGRGKGGNIVYLAPLSSPSGTFFLKESLTHWSLSASSCLRRCLHVSKTNPARTESLCSSGYLEIAAAVFWGATTLYIKRYLARKSSDKHILYQLVFSIPIMLLCAWLLEDQWVHAVDIYITASVVYQSVIVAFASYLVWLYWFTTIL